MKVRFKVEKGTALPIGNALRHLAMSRIPAWRPIAFSLNGKFNTINSPSNILEDTYVIGSNLSKLQYSIKEETREIFLKRKISFKEKITSGSLEIDGFTVIGEDIPIITSIDSAIVELTVLFRNGTGLYDSMDNSQFIMDNGDVPENYFVMSSRHTDISTFTFEVSESSSLLENLDVSIESRSRGGRVLLDEAIKALKESVNSLEVEEHLVN